MRGASAGVAALALVLTGCSALGIGGDDAAGEPTVLVMDASASMLTDDAPGPRIDAAKAAANGLIEGLPDEAVLGLVTYGTSTDDAPESQAAGCQDVTTLAEPVELGSDGHRAALLAEVGGLEPRGYTPIAESLRQAAGLLPEGDAAIIVVSDGEDACGDPPCEAAAELKEQNPGLRISTVGFKTATPELACIARTTGGLFVTADDADQLASRVLAARDADQNAAALTPTGLGGIDVGAHYNDISAAHDDFPGQGDGVTEGDYTVITYVDCDYVFDGDGVVVEVRPHDGRTVDGLTVGDSLDRATEIYGDEVDAPAEAANSSGAEEAMKGTSNVRYFVASREAGTAWKVGTDGDTITDIVLCECLPPSASAGSDTNGGGAEWMAPVAGSGYFESTSYRQDSRMVGQTEIMVYTPFQEDGTLSSEFEEIGPGDDDLWVCQRWRGDFYSCYQDEFPDAKSYFCSTNGETAWCATPRGGRYYARHNNIRVIEGRDTSLRMIDPLPVWVSVKGTGATYYFQGRADIDRPDATPVYLSQGEGALWAPTGQSAFDTSGEFWTGYHAPAHGTTPPLRPLELDGVVFLEMD